MKRLLAIGTLLALGLLPILAGAANNTPDHPDATVTVTPAEDRPSLAGSDDKFSGKAAIHMYFTPNEVRHSSGATVTFEPGARTAWHTHPAGQTLVVTDGTGWVQVWDQPRQKIQKGDVVWIPPHLKHWHGAAAGTALTHIALQETRGGEAVQWLELVSEEQYRGE